MDKINLSQQLRVNTFDLKREEAVLSPHRQHPEAGVFKTMSCHFIFLMPHSPFDIKLKALEAYVSNQFCLYT